MFFILINHAVEVQSSSTEKQSAIICHTCNLGGNRKMRNTRRTPLKGQNPTPTRKKKGHVSNGDTAEAEGATPAPPSSSDSLPEPPHSDSEGSDNESVAEEDEDDGGEEEKEVEVMKKKASGKHKRKVESEEAKCLFPMNRVRMIAKSEGGDDMRLSHEAIFLINKASEKFLGQLCEEAYRETVIESNNSVAYDHLSSSVAKKQRLCFLSDLIPVKITSEEALKERQLANTDSKSPTAN
uniref:Transcription factor CBF/NF-Y/archaeal histone domain-containing protein n=1 Tax=Kalanchoe fedtschenkoi TaxID=63787 RepID=A0A7N1A703_KALFE